MVNFRKNIDRLGLKYNVFDEFPIAKKLVDTKGCNTLQKQLKVRLKKEESRLEAIKSHQLLLPLLMVAISFSGYFEIVNSIEFKIASVCLIFMGLFVVMFLVRWKKKVIMKIAELHVLMECIELYKECLVLYEVENQ